MNTDFGIHPLNLIAALGLGLALIMIVVACAVKSRRGKAWLLVVAAGFLLPAAFVFLATHPELVDGRFRAYKAFYRDIQIGMTRDEVFAARDRRYARSGTRQPPMVVADQPGNLSFFMNPETSREPNCEGIFLTLDQGRVTRKVYSPD